MMSELQKKMPEYYAQNLGHACVGGVSFLVNLKCGDDKMYDDLDFDVGTSAVSLLSSGL